MVKIAGEIDFTNIVIENKLFEDLCVIADNLKDEFNDKIFAILFRRSLFLEDRSSDHSKFCL